MAKQSKRMQAAAQKIDRTKTYDISNALEIIKDASKVKFVESVDVAVVLGVDTRKSDQSVRGATVLPHGTGKTARVAVFAQGPNAEAAKAAGADKVGFEDLAEEIKAGKMDYDVIIASPDAMRIVGQLGQVLGPKGLMPNPKVGTVTPDVATAVKNAKGGQVRFRADKNGIVHCVIGKINFDANQLRENLMVLLAEIKKLKPATAKGVYLKKISISSTMGPGLVVDLTTVAA
ncbi:MAG: 50S ribosomal protein L1 [Gammaproteobacteria bacterium]|nr:50S ribosomal protein L1 [Gammaproteobacteria bacterium]